ncbi:MAG TPA: hypothetical protein VN881_00945 [Candidatus Acidoferrales bacterium]|jgi:hypothetical protein|nr:hypothetical protein [Candidatus Acidoferrales bacterium]
MDLTPQQISILERLRAHDFGIVAFPTYANYIGVRKGSCVALLSPVATGLFSVHGQPAYLIGENFSVRVKREGRDWFVWKKEKLEVTEARLAELEKFTSQLSQILTPVI